MSNRNINIMPIILSGAIGVYAIILMALVRLNKRTENAIEQINTQITDMRYNIDSVRNMLPRLVSDSMAHNPIFSEITQNRAYIDSLRTANDELIGRAYKIAKNNSMFSVPQRNISVFQDYSDIKGISPIAWKYYANDKKIRTYDKLRRENPNLGRAIQSHFDSIANVKISQLQNKMDSLLNEKHKLITQRQK